MGEDIETQLSVIKGHEVLLRTAVKLGIIPKSLSLDNVNLSPRIISTIYKLQDNIQVSREKFTNIINIKVTDTDPIFAQKLANTVALVYKEVHAEEQTKKTLEALKYISDQLKKFRSQLKVAEEEFNLFLQKNQIVSIDLESETLLVRKKELREKIQSIKGAIGELEGIKNKLTRFIQNPIGTGNEFYSIYATKQYQDAQSNLVTLILKKESLLEDYTSRHPKVIDIQRKIREQAKKMLLMINIQLESLKKKQAEVQNEMDIVERKTQDLMEKKLEYDRLKRKVDSLNDMVVMLEQKNQEASIKKAEKPEEVSIVRPAIVPSSPINPPKTLQTGIMGTIVGLLLGMIIAFIVETFDTSLGAIEDVEETLGTPVLGVIPHVNAKDLLDSIASKKDKERGAEFIKEGSISLVSHFAPNSLIAESFRALRTNIQFKDVERKIKAIGITSASPQEGKTLVAVNLAITMAQAGLKTLLIGGDLRKPVIGSIFGIESVPGFTDLLFGNYSLKEIVRGITDLIIGKMGMSGAMATPGLDNLHIITTGTLVANPAELIDSKAIDDVIEKAKQEYDYIIVDTPPILSTADPLIIAPKLDGILMVYRVGSVSKGLLKRSTLQLSQVKANLIGIVLNGMKAEVSPDFQDFKYFKYYYSYGKEKRKKKVKTMRRIPRFLIPVSALIAIGGILFTVLWEAGYLPSIIKGKEKAPTKSPVIIRKIKRSKRPIARIVEKSPQAIPEKVAKPPLTIAPSKEIKPERKSLKTKEEKTAQKIQKIPEVKTPEPSVTLHQSLPFTIQVGSYKDITSVNKTINELKRKGIGGFWMSVDLKDKGRWFRVLTGGFPGLKTAEKFQKEYDLSGTRIINTPWTVLITSPRKEIIEKLAEIEKMGYSLYYYNSCRQDVKKTKEPEPEYECISLIDKNGKSIMRYNNINIYVGAYTYKKNAERLAAKLRKIGIQCKPVLR